MNRVLFACSMLGIVAVAAWAYHINYRTGDTLREIDRLRAEIAKRHEELQVLRVEWAWLNNPERLRVLAERHADQLALVPIGPERFGDVAAVPYPAPAEVDPLEAALAAAAAAGAFIPEFEPSRVSMEAAAAERIDGGAAFFPVALPATRSVPLPRTGEIEVRPLDADAAVPTAVEGDDLAVSDGQPASQADDASQPSSVDAGVDMPGDVLTVEASLAPGGPVAPLPPVRPGVR
jgi:hypothetical protein